MRERRRATRRTAAAGGVLAVIAAVPPTARAAAPAEETGAAVGTATAGGVRTTYDLPGFLVVDQLFDAGGPVSQAVVNSSGGATAFASVPYPGDTVVNLPAAANVATGQPFPFTYPLYVVTDGNLTQQADARDATGTIALTAASHDRTAQSQARAGGPSAGVIHTAGSTQSSAVETAADGTMTSTADSLTRGIDIGVLKIAEVHVRSVSVLRPGQRRPTTTSSTDVAGAAVLGQAVGIGPDGIVLPAAGKGPADKPLLDGLNDALRKAGLSVSLAGAQGVAGGASAVGVQVVQRGALPFHGSPVGVARTVIGSAASFITGDSGTLTGLTVPSVAGQPVAPGAGSGPGAGPPAASSPTARTPTMSGGRPAVAGDAAAVPAGVVGNPSTPRTVALAAAPTGGTVAALGDLRNRIGPLYLVTSVGAALALLLSLRWRVKGVR